MTTRNQVLAEFPLISTDGSRHKAELVQSQTWHPDMKDPRWVDGQTFVELDGEVLSPTDNGKWKNTETGEEFSTV